jgi:hypothetical protein
LLSAKLIGQRSGEFRTKLPGSSNDEDFFHEILSKKPQSRLEGFCLYLGLLAQK